MSSEFMIAITVFVALVICLTIITGSWLHTLEVRIRDIEKRLDGRK